MRGFCTSVILCTTARALRTAPVNMCARERATLGDERRLLRGVLAEAIDHAQSKRTALEQQMAVGPDGDPEKAERRLRVIPKRLAECDEMQERLLRLRVELQDRDADHDQVRDEMEALGLGSRLASFDVSAAALAQWGRPDGFAGLVVESPRGIPVLVARQAFSDPLLRRVSRGTDLWFQVAEGRGSRVLLRTSMRRDLARSPRECMEFAADLAAYFSDARHAPDGVAVMFTDSRHSAKRGGRAGQLKYSKRMGTITGQSERVEAVARDAQEEQGWLN